MSSKPAMIGYLSLFDDDLEELDLSSIHREGTQLITFLLGQEKYGIKILSIRELVSYPETITPIPGMPDFVVGMINLRGLIVPVMDLRVRFQLERLDYNQFTVIVIVQVEDKLVGLIVDSVADVVYLEEEAAQGSKDLSSSIDTKFISGVANIKDDMVILLDVDYLLSEKELGLLPHQSVEP